jgi:hypothetical protein
VHGWGLCTAGAFITDRGEIVVQGFVLFSDGLSIFDLPVIGGTGEFDNVRGSVHVEDVNSERSQLTVTLIPLARRAPASCSTPSHDPMPAAPR